MSKSASLYIRVDPAVKAEVESIYSNYGISLTDAVNIFLYKSKTVGGLPFDLRPEYPNEETLAAMKESEDIIAGKIKSVPKSVEDYFAGHGL